MAQVVNPDFGQCSPSKRLVECLIDPCGVKRPPPIVLQKTSPLSCHRGPVASLEDALAAADQFVARYGGEFPTASEVLGQHLGECLTFYRFPERHWKTIRTSNVLERALREVRRRTNVVGRFPTETSALMVVFGVLEGERLKWRGLRMSPDNLTAIQEALKSLDQRPIPVTAFEKVLAA